MDNTIRVFIAIEPSASARAALVRLTQRMQQAQLRDLRWVDPMGVHLTLKFLGNIPLSVKDKVAEAMESAARGLGPFALALSNVGVFPSPGSPRVLWVGVQGDLEALGRLQERLEAGLERLGFPREARGFTPHLTLARVRDRLSPQARDRLAQVLASERPDWTEAEAAWEVREVVLMRSTLTPSGAIYQLIAKSTL